MWRETNIFGIYLPPLLIYIAATFACYLPLRHVFNRLRLFRWVWNVPLGETAVFLCILGALVRWL